jgi:hypothetical protein
MQTRLFFATTAVVVVTMLLVAGAYAQSGQPDNFTATMVTEGHSMPMARLGGKTRTDNAGLVGMSVISLMDARKTIMFSTATKTYFEGPMQDRQPSFYDPEAVMEKKRIGNETVDGHPCVKYDVVFYRKSKPEEKHKAVVWEAQDLKNFQIKTEIVMAANPKYPGSGGKIVSQFKDIKLGAATASMFEVPKGYRKASSAAEVMGMGGTGKAMKEMPKKR